MKESRVIYVKILIKFGQPLIKYFIAIYLKFVQTVPLFSYIGICKHMHHLAKRYYSQSKRWGME